MKAELVARVGQHWAESAKPRPRLRATLVLDALLSGGNTLIRSEVSHAAGIQSP